MIDSRAGGRTVFDENLQPHAMPKEWQTQGRFDIGKDLIAENREFINECFYGEVVAMFANLASRLSPSKILLTLVTRPVLLWEALRVSVAMRRHRGFLPSSEYIAWRIHTAYGDGMSETRQEDLASYLMWRRRMRRLS